MQERQRASFWLRGMKFPLEVVILGLGGWILAEAAILQAIATALDLPYYANGFYGILLVLLALQTAALGKTPLGTFARSPAFLPESG